MIVTYASSPETTNEDDREGRVKQMSMYTTYLLRTPGDHHEIARKRFDYVPRIGETVTMDDITRTVHSVDYDLSKNSITVALDP